MERSKKMLENDKINTKNRLQRKMKKIYTSPSVELAELEIENGIAMSTQTVDGINDIYLTEEEVDW
jgi:hypothetical protein